MRQRASHGAPHGGQGAAAGVVDDGVMDGRDYLESWSLTGSLQAKGSPPRGGG